MTQHEIFLLTAIAHGLALIMVAGASYTIGQCSVLRKSSETLRKMNEETKRQLDEIKRQKETQ